MQLGQMTYNLKHLRYLTTETNKGQLVTSPMKQIARKYQLNQTLIHWLVEMHLISNLK